MATNLQDGFRVGEFTVVPQQGLIHSASAEHKVQPKIIDVLLCLAAQPGAVVPRETIHDSVWGNIVVTDDALNRCISELRRAFGDKRGATRYIETVPKRGYRLMQSPESLDDTAASVTSAPKPAPGPPPLEAAIARVAVLPFECLTPNTPHAFLADALPTALHSGLARLNRIRVSSRRSSFAFRDSTLPIDQVGKQLDAQYIVSGNLAEAGDRIRIYCEVDDADSNVMLWSHRYETGLDNLLDIEAELTDALVGAFGGQRLRAEIGSTATRDHASLNAWELLQQARQYLLNYTPENLRNALDGIQQAVTTEPEYALAQAMYALLLSENIVNGLSDSPDEDSAVAATAAATALKLAAQDPAVLRTAGCALAYLGDYRTSLQTLRRSVELAPFDFGAWGYMGWPLSATGNPEDADELLGICARLLDNAPQHPGAPYWNYHKAIALTLQGNLDAALLAITDCLHAQPEFALGHWHLSNLHGLSGQKAAALDAADKARVCNDALTGEAYKSIVERLSDQLVARDLRLKGLSQSGVI